jgi:hypothetical protein
VAAQEGVDARVQEEAQKRRKIVRQWLSTMTKAISGRRARPTAKWPKWPQSTCACSAGSVRSRR